MIMLKWIFLHHLYTGGITKETVNLNLSFEDADSTPPPRKGSRLAKKLVYLPQSSKIVFMNTIRIVDSLSRLFSAFRYFEYMIML